MANQTKEPLKVRLDFNKLWKLLIDKKKNKEDLKRYGVSSASLVRMKNGSNVTTETLLRICQYLECDIADICSVISTENIND